MTLADLWIRPCTSMGDVRYFVETHHYSKSIQGITPFLSFEVVLKSDKQKQVGAAIFGMPGQVQTERKYGEYKGSKQLYRPDIVAVELRRFVLLEELSKNSESWLLSKMLHKLASLGVERIISYADPNQKREDHPEGRHTGLIYRAYGFHRVSVAGKKKAIIMQRDFVMDGKVFKKGRRLPIRNLDQYKNYRVRNVEELDQQVRHDWEIARRKEPSRATQWLERSTGRLVYVIKEESYLTSLSIRLRSALRLGAATTEVEDGKILYIKDLVRGMEYYETPRSEKDGIDTNRNTISGK